MSLQIADAPICAPKSQIPVRTDYSSARRALFDNGCVYMPGRTFVDPVQMATAMETLVGQGTLIAYEEDKISPRSRLGEFVYTSTDFSAVADIYLHNECCTKPSWPLYIGFYCRRAADKGGNTTVSSIREVTRNIPVEIRDRFHELGILYTRNLGGDIGNSISYTFGTVDRETIDRYCADAGMKAEWVADDRLRLSFSREPMATHPKSDEVLWFNNAVFWNPRSLDRILQLGLRNRRESEFAFNSYFGDGTPIPTGWVDAVKRVYDASRMEFAWTEGGFLILDNMLYAHGREKFQGEREVWVTMAHAVKRKSPNPIAA